MRFMLRQAGAAGLVGIILLAGCQSASRCATEVTESCATEPCGGPSGACGDQACKVTHADGSVRVGECTGCEHCDGTYADGGIGPCKWSEDWYEERAHLPVGTRQVYHKGKMWPPYPRPVGPEQPICHRYHAAHYWPHPYNCQDRESVRSFINSHVNKGWEQHTTLYHYHFDEETAELNHAGRAHLQYIVDEVPDAYKAAFVQTGPTVAVSQARLASVQSTIETMVGPGFPMPIELRRGGPVSTPAQQVDTQYRGWMQSLPQPRLQYTPLQTQQQ